MEERIIFEGISVQEFLRMQAELMPKQSATIEQDAINIKGASEVTGLSVPSINKLKAKGKIPYAKMGGRVVFLKSKLQEWLKNETYMPK